LRPRHRLRRRARAPRPAARVVLRRRRVGDDGPGRAPALGQAAHAHRRAAAHRLPRLRRRRGPARPGRSRAPVRQPLPGTGARMNVHDLTTPALLVDTDALTANLADMATALPGA